MEEGHERMWVHPIDFRSSWQCGGMRQATLENKVFELNAFQMFESWHSVFIGECVQKIETLGKNEKEV
jgi:hypothetical protein